MAKSPHQNTSIDGERKVSSAAVTTGSITDAIADALVCWPAKVIAERLRKIAPISERTVEGWKQRKRTPHARHFVAMLNDDELCEALLTKLGRADIATRAKMVAMLKETQAVIGKAAE